MQLKFKEGKIYFYLFEMSLTNKYYLGKEKCSINEWNTLTLKIKKISIHF